MSSHSPYRVMTVCTGNICRSPIAEVVLRDRFARAGLGEDVVVDSSGTSDEERGNPIDPRAAQVLREAGYDVPDHRAHRVSSREIGDRDLLLAMTAQHARALRTQAPDGASAQRVVLYRSFDPAAPATEGGSRESDLDIADPWYGGPEDFAQTLAEVEAGADGVVERVRAELSGRAA